MRRHGAPKLGCHRILLDHGESVDLDEHAFERLVEVDPVGRGIEDAARLNVAGGIVLSLAGGRPWLGALALAGLSAVGLIASLAVPRVPAARAEGGLAATLRIAWSAIFWRRPPRPTRRPAGGCAIASACRPIRPCAASIW